MAIQEQVHDKFKVFIGSSIDDLSSQVHDFSKDESVAPKSIGVEFLESKQQIVVCLGYRNEPGSYSVKLIAKSVGVIDFDSEASIASFENQMDLAASASGNIICHELYVTGEGEAVAVFMAKE